MVLMHGSEVSQNTNFKFVDQTEQLGLGHAVYQGLNNTEFIFYQRAFPYININ